MTSLLGLREQNPRTYPVRQDVLRRTLTLLRPRAWVESQGLRVGRAFALNIPELEVLGSGNLHSISECPELAEGDGSFVTGRFATRRVEQTVTLQLEDGSSVEGTAIHPFWSLDRQDWVPMGELQVGELLQSEHGPVAVASLTVHHRPCEVYNIEVHGEHVYQIGEFGVLVHNTCAPVPSGQIHHPIPVRVGRALNRHPMLRGHFQPRDPRFTTRAIDDAAHRGYQTWHRDLDLEVVRWIERPRHATATPEQFLDWLRWRYSQPDLLARFPNGF